MASKILYTVFGFVFGVFTFWFFWKGAVVEDWQEFVRVSFGVLSYIGILNLIVCIWH